MTEKDMRLRLVVRRDGLPEERLVWNVALENDPTVSKLLEKVNEIVPLEFDQRGLEDYAVELHDDDGTSFECLHFHSVRTVFKPDDRVFIRALDRDDNRRRRISGRHQISSDGRRLIDGIPFGRRLLKAPSGRPPVTLPPRKRPRLAYNHENLDDSDNGEDTSMLLLTNGDQPEDPAVPLGARVGVDLGADTDAEDEEFDSEPDPHVGGDYESEDYDQESSESPSDEDPEDLEDELQDLLRDNADFEENGEHEAQAFKEKASNKKDRKISAVRAAFPSAPTTICKKILESSGGNLKAAYNSLAEGFEPKLSDSALLAWPASKDKVSFKSSVPREISSTKATFSKCLEETSRDAMNDGESESESSGTEMENQVSALVRQFDHRGLPPGSITSSKGLAQMAAISGSHPTKNIADESETATTALNDRKTNLKNLFAEDDETSSAATSSSSESEGSGVEADSDSDEDTSSDHSGTSDDSDEDNTDDESHENDSDDNESDSEDGDLTALRSDAPASSDKPSEDSSEDSGSGPEETSTRPSGLEGSLDHDDSSSQDGSSSSEASDDSDVSCSEGSSDEGSSEAESSSESESESVKMKTSSIDTGAVKLQTMQESIDKVLQVSPSGVAPNMASETKSVPPGAGKESTKKRNARRRAARKAKMQALPAANFTDASLAGGDAHHSTPRVLDEKALFEAKRQELLDAIASGGVEVGPFSHPYLPKSPTTTKRKCDEQDELSERNEGGGALAETPISEENQLSSSAQKRRRIDVDAGRRLLFGALGLRNPKTNEDADELRVKFMKDVRPHVNTRLEQENNDTHQTRIGNPESAEEDPDAWRDKISYRAVECCHEGVELSEPPFPFVQRWDPQQQGSWFQKKNKRGGQSKRVQRNEAHFYQDSRSSRKRKHDESTMWDEEGYNDTFNGIDDNTNADVELDYDEPEDGQYHGTNELTNDASQFTDIDDLPSLPSDLSTLPILRPGEVQVGMVITWQQWACSSATGWQPQISSVTGVVVRVDDDATGLEVCLAKRDRYFDRNQKKYDQNTGQRIYDRFEAPDLDEEDGGEDEGFRTIGFAEMQQPRILQQPLPVITSEQSSEKASQHAKDGRGPGTERSAALEDVKVNASPERSGSKESPKEDAPGIASSKTSQSEQGQQSSDVSISNPSGTSSPSRQLHEGISQAGRSISRGRSAQGASSHENTGLNSPSDKTSQDVSGLYSPSAMQSSAPLFDSHENEVVTGTPKIVRSTVPNPPSSVSSARSGRQPDHTLDMDVMEPDSFKITDDGVSAALGAEGQRDSEMNEAVSSPTPKANRQSGSGLGPGEATEDAQLSSPAHPSTPSSLSSINTIWCTALTSRNTQTPSQPQTQSQSLPTKASKMARILKDKEYGEAMRKLDDFSDDREELSCIPDSFKRSNQVSGLDGSVEDDVVVGPSPESPQIKISPSLTRRRKSPKSSSQFRIPPGSQVVELSSDSEPVYTEDYADDEVDKTYSPEPDSFPTGNGWVHKKMDIKNRNARSVTATIKPQSAKRRRLLSSSQGPPSTSSANSTSQFGPVKPQRKTSSRF
ncbi:hypothetical protein F5Y13DRAFT_205097 [Hypoxylon sp. FL1857]|nr:hypothetical protein F5Y13DRAFT_205097 [Hypoxylon sp. FL1857]